MRFISPTNRFIIVLFLISQCINHSFGFLVSAREYVCTETSHKLIIDAWSIKDQLIYLRMNHYTNTSLKEIDQRLIVYDIEQDKFLNVFLPHDRHSIAQAEGSTILSNIVSAALIKSFNEHRSPSALYFDSRIALRSNCQTNWFYDPPHSGFCRRHSVTLNLGRILALVNQMSLSKPDNMDYDLYRATRIRAENFGSSTVRPVTRWSLNSIQDSLSQLITASTLSLQVNHNNLSPIGPENVRFLFSNKLGLFMSWLPSNNEIPPPAQDNCAILLPVKLQPTIRICSKQYSFVSIIEVDPFIYIIIPENRIIPLSHDYLTRQFRIHNKLEINLDLPEHEPRELFETIFKCSNNRKLKSTIQDIIKSAKQNLTDLIDTDGSKPIHQITKRQTKESTKQEPITPQYWYYLAPIGTYIIVSNSLLLVLYIVEKDVPYKSMGNDEKRMESTLARNVKCRESKKTADILRLFRLSPSEAFQLKSSIMEK